jgi:ABC-type multidrug transport system ATPase subunit
VRVIRTHALTKTYGDLVAVDGLDLDVREGDVYGFLGANGSGKTTTVRMLLGLVLATSGDIEVLDQPMPRAARRVLPSVGCLVEGPAAYPHLSGRANLSLFDAMGGGSSAAVGSAGRRGRRARVADALDQVGLSRAADRRVRGYSLGMRQRLGLASALLQKPRLLVLDEPTNGLDPQGIREMRDLLLALNATGTTVFLSSHLLAEVEQLCSRVGVLDRGRLVVQEDLAVLQAPTGRVVVTTSRPADAVGVLDGRVEERVGTRLVVRAAAAAEVNALLVAGGVPVDELGPERRGLEQVVLEATEGTGDIR